MRLQRLISTLVVALGTMVAVMSQADAANLGLADVKNAEYYSIMDRKIYKFKDGGAAMGGGGGINLHKVLFGDLNNDGQGDAAVVLEESGGASAIYYQLSAVINKNGKPLQIDSVMLGDHVRIDKFRIENGAIVVELTSSPRFPPVQRKTVKYRLVGNKLVGPPAF